MSEPRRKNILLAPLDWGLGHTTRCIPIINELLKNGANVLVAGNTVQQLLLKKEFSQLIYLPLEGYNVRYTTQKNRFVSHLMRQLPGLLKAIRQEHRWLRRIVKEYAIDGVISDNRFGLHHPELPAVFITHQLKIKNPLGAFMETVSRKINYRWISRFSACWIPDYPQAPGLAGDLSHPDKMPGIPCAYLGPLSRMQPLAVPGIKNRILLLLSGPEPQRSLFEKIICEQLPYIKGNIVLVRGLPEGNGPELAVPSSVVVYDHLPAATLNLELCKADVVVCRSGYSSVMDLQAIGATPVLIPTPGQTEQEYLAALLGDQKKAVTGTQDSFDLAVLLEKAKALQPVGPVLQAQALLEKAVQEFLTG
ncbi:glycosyltransferase [Niabella beijingensis]|uniref:glycosyltransferase n=1 Tax=Niabella beijingensis TaxID=2872700 RepID=UPI001CC12F3C|nr:glycosyltransferase [Niabella beijingensis]MBZ4189727.1 glycosyl transferase family 28 [Niabella beijingensis]